jgi:hypothetical protein
MYKSTNSFNVQRQKSFCVVKMFRESKDIITITFSDAYTQYQLNVAAYTRRGMGEKSTSFQALSDVEGKTTVNLL